MYVSTSRSSQLAAKDGHSASAVGVRSARNCSAGANLNPANRTSSTMTEISPIIERPGRRSDMNRETVSDAQSLAWRFYCIAKIDIGPESPVLQADVVHPI